MSDSQFKITGFFLVLGFIFVYNWLLWLISTNFPGSTRYIHFKGHLQHFLNTTNPSYAPEYHGTAQTIKTKKKPGDCGFVESDPIRETFPSMRDLELHHVRNGNAVSGKIFTMKRMREFPSKGESNSSEIGPFVQDSYPRGKRWAVITSIFYPARLVRQLCELPDWCTVVVADMKSPNESEYNAILFSDRQPHCFVYLTVAKQLELDYEILHFLPFNSFGRKNIGYVFATHHGAHVIYDTDDDNEIGDMDLFHYWSNQGWLHENISLNWRTSGSNPYLSLGAEYGIWPRGLPLDSIKTGYKSTRIESFASRNRVCMIQSLANREPDVDAIYRLTNIRYPISFYPETRYSACVLDYGVLAPFNAQATMFFRDAVYSMLLPVTVHGRVSDIWRGYIAQSIKTIDCELVFSAPWVTQIRNAHNYLADFDAEIPLYTQATALVQHLSNGKYEYVVDAYLDAYAHGILQENDVFLSMAWERDLDRAILTSDLEDMSNLQHVSSLSNFRPIFRHLLIIMGKGEHIRKWMEAILSDSALTYVDILGGVFDSPVESLECPLDSKRVTCISVSGTTWASGRNLLAQKAFRLEYDLGIQYTFWTFADADVSLSCITPASCFGQYNTFLSQLPKEIMVAATLEVVRFDPKMDSIMVGLQGFDAAWNSFRREVIPLLLPYRTEQDENTWWSSQAIFWNRVQCLHPYYAVAPLFIFYQNPEHNPYPRNPRNFNEERVIAEKMMGTLAGSFPRAPTDYLEEIKADKIRSWPLDAPLNENKFFRTCADAFSRDFYEFISSWLPS